MLIQSHHQLQCALDFGLLKHMSLWCVSTIIQRHHQLQYAVDFGLLKHMSLWCVSTIIQSHHQLQYALYMLIFYTFYLVKNITNNLLNSEKFVFLAFEFSDFNVQCLYVYVKWGNIQKIYDFYTNLESYLRKPLKLLYKALHPGNNKQNVS